MLKRLSFAAALVLPSLAFAQTAVPARPNHTLPQYGAVTAANSNAGAPRAMLRMATPSAGSTYAALWPPGGLSRDTRVPSLYTDGSSGTLEQIGQMADGSVQQADANQPHGYVQPDGSGAITLPVTGNIASAASQMLYGTIARTTADARADHQDVRDYGFIGRPDAAIASDEAAIQTAVTSAWGNDLHFSPHQGLVWPDTHWTPRPTHNNAWGPRIIGNGYIQNIPTFTIDNHARIVNFGSYMPSFTANDATGNVERGFVFSQVDGDGQTYHWPVEISSVNDDAADPSGWSGDVLHKTLLLISGSTKRSNGEMDGLAQTYYSDGLNKGAAYDVVHHPVMLKFGTNWGWLWNPELHEVGGWDCGNDEWSGGTTVGACASIIAEMDIYPSGPELARSHYDSKSGSRSFIDISGQPSPNLSWSASAHFSHYQMIDVINPDDGKKYIYVSASDGVTGAAEPKWSFNAAPIKDGGITWSFRGLKRPQVSKAIALVGGVEFGTFLEVEPDAPIYNAIADFSQARWTDDVAGGVHVTMRQPSNSYLDLTGDGSSQGKNNHVLGYDSSQQALTYKVNGVPVLSVKDSGAIVSSAPPQMPVMTRAQIRAYPSPAKGMEIYDSDDDAPAIYTGVGWKLMSLSAFPAN